MMNRLIPAVLLGFLLALGGCGSSAPAGAVPDAGPGGTPQTDAAPEADGPTTPPDGAVDGPEALAPVGAACRYLSECAGGMCLVEELGFPGGYCTHLDCDPDDPSESCLPYGGDGYCLVAGETGSRPVCLDRCDPEVPDCRAEYSCRRIGPGLAVCLPLPVCGNGRVEFGEECEPPSTDVCDDDCQGLGRAPVGAACDSAMECAGNFCIDDWPAGYCTLFDCDLAAPDSSCAAAEGDGYCLNTGTPSEPFGICLDRCIPAAPDCRTDYQCVTLPGGFGLCMPEPECGNGLVEFGEECEPPNTATCDAACQGLGKEPVGAPCTSPMECAGNFCIDDWPAGYCTLYGCDLAAPDTSCAAAEGDGFCLDVGTPSAPFGLCLDRCDPAAPDCRTDYRCVALPGGFGVCMPDPICGNGMVEFGEECEPPGTATCDANCQGLGKEPVGAPCTSPMECAGNYCIDDWPEGYCTLYDCDLAAPDTSCAAAEGDGYCLDVGTPSAPFGICLDRCDPADPDCRTDYTCVTLPGGFGVCMPDPVCGNGLVEFGEECEPPNTATCDANCQGLGQEPVGAPCTSPMECAGNFCIDDWPEGYCTLHGCDPDEPETSCVPGEGDGYCLNVGTSAAPFGICLDRCNPALPDCRDGYECFTLPGGLGVCMADPVCGNGMVEFGEECEPPDTATCDSSCQGFGTLPVGAPCTSPMECAGNFCIGDWPAGYCTLYDCDLDAADTSCIAAGGDGVCFDVGGWGSPFGVCLDRCDPAAPDCRTDYQCLDLGGGEGVCMPDPVCGNGMVEFGEECEPPDTATCDANCQGLGTEPIGAACTSPMECGGNLCLASWPDGYCSHLPCDLSDPEGSCLPYGGDGLCGNVSQSGPPIGMCFDRCLPLFPDCRPGYYCLRQALMVGVCMPDPVCGNGIVERGEECEPPDTASCNADCQGLGTEPIGAACTSSMECAGNLCYDDGAGWPGGYCSQLDCDPFDPIGSCQAYGGDGHCVILDLFGAMQIVCLDECQNQNDCRTGYDCQDVWLGTRACVPQ